MIGPWRIHGHAIVSADDTHRRPRRPDAAVAAQRGGLAALPAGAGRSGGHRARPPRPRGQSQRQGPQSPGAVVLGAWRRAPRRCLVVEPGRRAAGRRAAAARRPAAASSPCPAEGGSSTCSWMLGFDEFHLARAESVRIPDGIPIFSGVAEGRPAEALLAAHGLVADETEVLDSTANVTLTRWRRAAGGNAAA